MAFEAAKTADLDGVRALLRAVHLPDQDVDEALLADFLVLRSNGALVAVGALMSLDERTGLVRSIAVDPALQGDGLGSRVLRALEERAASGALESLFLLTTTAPGFFSARGYEEVFREDAPTAVRTTTQFAELCPTSAIVMRKRLSTGRT